MCAMIKHLRPALWTAGLTLAAMTTAHAGLDRTERAVARHAAKGAPAAEALLQRVVDIESPTEDVAGVRAVGDVFAAELQAIGFRTHWVDMPPEMKRAGHLVAETRGHPGQAVIAARPPRHGAAR